MAFIRLLVTQFLVPRNFAQFLVTTDKKFNFIGSQCDTAILLNLML